MLVVSSDVSGNVTPHIYHLISDGRSDSPYPLLFADICISVYQG